MRGQSGLTAINNRMKSNESGGVEGRIKLELFDENGGKVTLWNENKLGKITRRFFASFGDSNFAKYGIRLPGFGKWAFTLEQHNLFVNSGISQLTALMGGVGSPTVFGYLEVGTGTTAAAAAQTALITPITDSGLARAASTNTQVTTTITNDTLRMVKTWSVTGTKAITEIGAFDAASAGNMAGRSVFSAINVANGYVFIGTYDFQITAA